ncbi:ZAR1-like protein [Kryptolebias marmoratus]|uniref:Zygote arrest 1-like n=1 Tax=Kryptolebias marmoratus TaxID=37003 RepID=A0A3Q2ZXK5_KRYMA|nr:ZAR1-like protein [Kryptolebias marmoratus]
MEGFLSTFPPYSVYAPPARGGGWGKREGRFMTPQGLNYLELCKSILSQVNPGLPAPPALPAPPPAPRRASTRECGVQVNARVDQVVQCSLGPKTLLCRDERAPRSPEGKAPLGLRFLRPVSIYSPVSDRGVRLQSLGGGDGGDDSCGGEGGREGGDASEAAESDLERSDGNPEKDAKPAAVQRSSRGSNFQFLEQRYGFFHCKKCNIRWESAYVWCISGTSKVYYKQLCRKCQVGFNPYRVESILCKGCSQTCCICEKKQRHINMKRPHRQDLCCRCKGMRLSCDATYSFKYIV